MMARSEKFKSLVHYICSKCDDPTLLGGVKLNKILWFSDVLSYLNFANPMTGETYKKRQFGPVPSTILATLDELQAEQKLVVKQVNFQGFPKKEFISLEEPDISDFSADEISLVDSIIENVCENHTAKSISEATHNEIWEMANIGEEIPYHSILVNALGEIDENDLEWAREQVQTLSA